MGRAEMNSELVIRYDDHLQPVSGQCSSCGQQMPKQPSGLQDTTGKIAWLSEQFVAHKRSKHPTPRYGNDDPPSADNLTYL